MTVRIAELQEIVPDLNGEQITRLMLLVMREQHEMADRVVENLRSIKKLEDA